MFNSLTLNHSQFNTSVTVDPTVVSVSGLKLYLSNEAAETTLQSQGSGTILSLGD